MKLSEKIKSGFTYFEGGCGTILQSKGLKPGELPETWNILHPDIITGMHYDYLTAGADIIKTNTFGANILKYAKDDEQFSLSGVIEAAIANAGEARVRAGREDAYIALDVGPLGKLLKPLGDMEFEKAVGIFAETVKIGAAAGADAVLIETMNDIYEAKAAVLAVKENCDLPIILTCAFDESGKLLTGADPVTVVTVAEALGVTAVGVNCSVGPRQMADVVKTMAEYASVPVVCCPNAGLPRVENGKTVFDVDPQDFAEAFEDIVKGGATILGGCCGTTPAHIKAMHDLTVGMEFSVPTTKTDSLISSYTHSVAVGDKTVLIGERINPTGKSKFKQALRDHNIDYILQEGLTQQDKKADVLDVNVGLPEIDEVAMMKEVVTELQAVTDLPLQIDTTNIEAMEQALRLYNGKAMVNSVNGKEEVMREVFPLVAKYGGLCVALTLDEGGIPDNAKDRVSIALKIVKRAADYGIQARDLIIDPLCMSISADPNSANVTLESLRLLRDEHGLNTVLGVSNISFGLPNRDLINGTFFAMAMQNGLSAAIMNPNSSEMMKAYYTHNALRALDENCMEYVDYAVNFVPDVKAPVQGGKTSDTAGASGEAKDKNAGADNEAPLVTAIRKGLKDRAAALTEEMIKTESSMDIIDGYLIPALDIVGKGFENKTIFLPQLLMSAEAANSAFAVIKETIAGNAEGDGDSKGKIIVATVKGDIHDIGKNIVKVLLENYGYDVYDLGKDVAPELIVETAIKEDIRLIGLSALMTTTVPAMEETIKQLRASGCPCRVVVGGAVMTKEYADMIGADKYCKDAMETVRYAEEVLQG
ncbi:MAG: homocysteine S-methyltransferase family protein [Lachnospiraceae bacterium]|nr:homocysteine S-methyltransferase family protein [Lachnospiraceae bacterium]